MTAPLCPRCHVNPCALEDIPESGRWEHKRPAKFCAPCMAAEGYVLAEQVITESDGVSVVSWWVKPAPKDEMSIDELFDRLAGPQSLKHDEIVRERRNRERNEAPVRGQIL